MRSRDLIHCERRHPILRSFDSLYGRTLAFVCSFVLTPPAFDSDVIVFSHRRDRPIGKDP
jgi:hypothetical protein